MFQAFVLDTVRIWQTIKVKKNNRSLQSSPLNVTFDLEKISTGQFLPCEMDKVPTFDI